MKFTLTEQTTVQERTLKAKVEIQRHKFIELMKPRDQHTYQSKLGNKKVVVNLSQRKLSIAETEVLTFGTLARNLDQRWN